MINPLRIFLAIALWSLAICVLYYSDGKLSWIYAALWFLLAGLLPLIAKEKQDVDEPDDEEEEAEEESEEPVVGLSRAERRKRAYRREKVVRKGQVLRTVGGKEAHIERYGEGHYNLSRMLRYMTLGFVLLKFFRL